MKKSYVLNAFLESPWAILPSMLPVLQEIVMRHAAGEKLSADEIQARTGGGGAQTAPNSAVGVGVISIHGPIAPRMHMLENISNGTSADYIGRTFTKLVKDPSVSAIVLDIASPGGQVSGIRELSDKIFNARGAKPIVAVASPMMASAAYFIGTAADEVVVEPSGQVGSIGVFSAHEDWSGHLEKEGIKVTMISAGKYKTEGNYFEPLTDEARQHRQAIVDAYYDEFVDAVARNRGVRASAVRNGFGQGRMVSARQAVDEGMADRIGTLEETVERLLSGNYGSAAGAQASGNALVPSAQDTSEPAPKGDSEPALLSEQEQRAAQELREFVETFI